jgi:nitroreductase
MEFMDVVKLRRSVRRFKDTPIPESVISDIIEAGRLSPSSGDNQNWYFGVITDKSQRESLAYAAGEQMWISSAPIIIAICTKIDWNISTLPDDDFGLEVNKARFSSEFIEYLQKYPNQKAVSTLFSNSASFIPGEQMYLAAVNHGLGACWIGFLDIEKANEILGLPDNIICLNLIPIGYPNEKPQELGRKEPKEIVFYDKWK